MKRRAFLAAAIGALALGRRRGGVDAARRVGAGPMSGESMQRGESVLLFLAGDVMTGRGIDQVLPHPGDPRLFEPFMKRASGYVELAEQAHGPIPRPVEFPYIWGDARGVLERTMPDLGVINLETSITANDEPWPGKGIHYRMHPDNVPCLTAAPIDCCVLANNHLMDWGTAGLCETLERLQAAGLPSAGAGRNLAEASRPAIFELPGKGRALVFGFGDRSSGIPRDWGARPDRAGVNLLPDLGGGTTGRIAAAVRRIRRAGDLVIASIHWGSNWGYAVPAEQREFAHRLISEAGVDIVHGHSSHHPRPIEVFSNRPILYGCGDLLNDYEGIAGHEQFRADLALMYFVTMDSGGGGLIDLHMIPMQIRRFRLNRAGPADTRWLAKRLDGETRELGSRIEATEEGGLLLRWRALRRDEA